MRPGTPLSGKGTIGEVHLKVSNKESNEHTVTRQKTFHSSDGVLQQEQGWICALHLRDKGDCSHWAPPKDGRTSPPSPDVTGDDPPDLEGIVRLYALLGNPNACRKSPPTPRESEEELSVETTKKGYGHLSVLRLQIRLR